MKKFLLGMMAFLVVVGCGDFQRDATENEPAAGLSCGFYTHQQGTECVTDNNIAVVKLSAAGNNVINVTPTPKTPPTTCGRGTKKIGNQCMPFVEGMPCEDNDSGTGTPCVTTLCQGPTSNNCKEVPGTLVCGLGYYICSPPNPTTSTSLDFCDADLRDTDGDGSNYEDDPHLDDQCYTLINFGTREDGSEWVTPTAGLLKCLKNVPDNVMQLVCEPLCKLPVDWDIHEVCGNGMDDNCDGRVDEGCPGEEPKTTCGEGTKQEGNKCITIQEELEFAEFCNGDGSCAVRKHGEIDVRPYSVTSIINSATHPNGYEYAVTYVLFTCAKNPIINFSFRLEASPNVPKEALKHREIWLERATTGYARGYQERISNPTHPDDDGDGVYNLSVTIPMDECTPIEPCTGTTVPNWIYITLRLPLYSTINTSLYQAKPTSISFADMDVATPGLERLENKCQLNLNATIAQ